MFMRVYQITSKQRQQNVIKSAQVCSSQSISGWLVGKRHTIIITEKISEKVLVKIQQQQQQQLQMLNQI